MKFREYSPGLWIGEANRIVEEARQVLCQAPAALRPAPEDRDRAEKEVRREAKVKDVIGQDLTLRRLKDEADARLKAQTELSAVPAPHRVIIGLVRLY